MEIIIGFIIMIILTLVSAIPIFIMLKIMKKYNSAVAWVLFFVCTVIYIVLKAICMEYDIISSKSASVPLVAMFILFSLSQIGTIEKNTKENKNEKHEQEQ